MSELAAFFEKLHPGMELAQWQRRVVDLLWDDVRDNPLSMESFEIKKQAIIEAVQFELYRKNLQDFIAYRNMLLASCRCRT